MVKNQPQFRALKWINLVKSRSLIKAPNDDEQRQISEQSNEARNEFWLDIHAPPASECAYMGVIFDSTRLN